MVLNELLKDNNMTIYRLSEGSGVPYTTVNDICKGKVRIEKCSGETLYKLAIFLEISMEDLVGKAVEQKNIKRTGFTEFKSDMCHRLKFTGDLDFIIWLLEEDLILRYYGRQWYRESLYLLAMLDHLSKENELPLCDKYDDLRSVKLAEPLYPAMISIVAEESGNDTLKKKCMEEALPEFKKYNIIEGDIRDVC